MDPAVLQQQLQQRQQQQQQQNTEDDPDDEGGEDEVFEEEEEVVVTDSDGGTTDSDHEPHFPGVEPEPEHIQEGTTMYYIGDVTRPTEWEQCQIVKVHFDASTGYYFTIAVDRSGARFEKQTTTDRLRTMSYDEQMAMMGDEEEEEGEEEEEEEEEEDEDDEEAEEFEEEDPEYAEPTTLEHQETMDVGLTNEAIYNQHLQEEQELMEEEQQMASMGQIPFDPNDPNQQQQYGQPLYDPQMQMQMQQQQQMYQQPYDGQYYAGDVENAQPLAPPPALYQPQAVRPAATTNTTVSSQKTRALKEENNWLTAGLVVACCLLLVALGGVGAVLFLWLDDDDDDTVVRVSVPDTLTPAPISPPSRAPTPAPTLAPGTTATPTSAPSPAPTTVALPDWTITTAGTVPRSEPTDFGSSIAMAGTNYMVTGEPRFGANFVKPGQLLPFTRSASGEAFVDQGVLADATEISVERFGSSVDMILDASSNLPLLAVGSTRTKGLEQTNDRFGSAFYYEYDGSSFVPIGGTLRGNEGLAETGGLLGYSIALAQTETGTKRIALSSPSSSIVEGGILDVGRIYTYELNETATEPVWEPMTLAPLIGSEAGVFLGAGIDLNNDGSLLVAGAPGSVPADGTADGQVFVYSWSGTAWESLTVASSVGTTGSSMGSRVQWIAEDSTDAWFAVSAPTHDESRGMVRVYQRVSVAGSVSFAPLGNDIVGASPNDLVGSALCGRNGRLATGTSNGEFSVYDYSSSSGWNLVGSPFVPVEGSTVVACAFSSDGNTLTVGTATFQIFVYDFM